MTAETLQRLIDGGETLSVEFKGEERSPLNDRDLVETVVCLVNRAGNEPSWLLIGVEDDGRVTGARPRHGGSTNPDRVAALIAARTRPALSASVETVSIGHETVLVIEVPAVRQTVGTGRQGSLRAPTRVRALAAGTDGTAVRGEAWINQPGRNR